MLPVIDFRRIPVTVTLAMIIVALEVVCTLDPDRRVYYYTQAGLGILPTLWDGQPWQPLTTSLLHANLIHAGFNLYWLWLFGEVLERRLGHLRFLVVCVLLAYVSMLPEFIVSNYRSPINAQVGVLGFSGVCYGLFGLVWVGRRRHADMQAVCSDEVVRVLLGWFVLCIVLTWGNILPVANIAHGAGLAVGALYGMAAFGDRRRWLWAAISIAVTAAVLATLAGFPGHRGYEAVRHQQRLQQFFERMQNMPPQ